MTSPAVATPDWSPPRPWTPAGIPFGTPSLYPVGSLPNGAVMAAYDFTVTATGGQTPYTFSAAGLPAGLTINTATGEITGTPTTAGTSSVIITVTDAAGATAQQTYSLVIAAAALAVTTTALPEGSTD